MEGILGAFGNGFSLTGLIEKNAQAFDVEGLNWYYGGGARIAFYNGHRYYGVDGRDLRYRDSHDVGVGINGIIGLGMLPINIPLAFSLDRNHLSRSTAMVMLAWRQYSRSGSNSCYDKISLSKYIGLCTSPVYFLQWL